MFTGLQAYTPKEKNMREHENSTAGQIAHADLSDPEEDFTMSLELQAKSTLVMRHLLRMAKEAKGVEAEEYRQQMIRVFALLTHRYSESPL